MSLREAFLSSLTLTPKNSEPTKSKVDQFYTTQLLGKAVDALLLMQHRHGMRVKEEDIRHAASSYHGICYSRNGGNWRQFRVQSNDSLHFE